MFKLVSVVDMCTIRLSGKHTVPESFCFVLFCFVSFRFVLFCFVCLFVCLFFFIFHIFRLLIDLNLFDFLYS